MRLGLPLARPGHFRSFPTRAQFLTRSTSERQVSGDESEAAVGSTRPSRVIREGQLQGELEISGFCPVTSSSHRYESYCANAFRESIATAATTSSFKIFPWDGWSH